jgi:segregation and condensation protein B
VLEAMAAAAQGVIEEPVEEEGAAEAAQPSEGDAPEPRVGEPADGGAATEPVQQSLAGLEAGAVPDADANDDNDDDDDGLVAAAAAWALEAAEVLLPDDVSGRAVEGGAVRLDGDSHLVAGDDAAQASTALSADDLNKTERGDDASRDDDDDAPQGVQGKLT